MKNSRYFPYERNRYFYGKLLTVRDFETEQKYVNDKRRLVNRLMHGPGVVSGLQVVAVDEKSVSVEMGVALDAQGREIVVASPVTLKLSAMDGFSNNEYAKNVYLCIAYDEKGKEPVHSVGNSTGGSEEINEYNRVAEGYKLFVREEAPDPSSFHINHLVETTNLIYHDQTVNIWQKVPRYVNPGEIFEVTIKVDKTLQTPPLFFEFDIESDYFSRVHHGEGTKITFIEPKDSQQTEYEITYSLEAKKNYDVKRADISIIKDSIILKIGDKQVDVSTNCVNTVEVIEGQINDKFLESYFEQTLEQTLASTPDQAIYLAKISLLQMGPTYMIEGIEQVPFGEYVYNPSVLYKIEKARQKSLAKTFLAKSTTKRLSQDEDPYMWVDYNQDKNLFDFTLGIPEQNSFSDEVNMGTVQIELKEKGKAGKGLFSRNENRYYSDEIEHGLEKGPVFIHVGLEETNGGDVFSDLLHNDEKIYSGDLAVFRNSEYETEIENISIGTIVYPKKGTFRIGIKTEGIIDVSQVKVRWWAFRKKVDEKYETIPTPDASLERDDVGEETTEV